MLLGVLDDSGFNAPRNCKHTDPGFPSSLQHYAISKHRSAGIREITLASHSYASDKTSPEHHFIVTSLDYVTYNTLPVIYGM